MPLVKTPMSALALPHTSPRAAPGAREAAERRRQRVLIVATVAVCCCLMVLWGMVAQLPAPAQVHHAVEERLPRRTEQERRSSSNAPRRRSSRGFRDDKQIVVLLVSDREGDACARQLVSAKALAYRAPRVHFRVFEELYIGQDVGCVERFCELEPSACGQLLRSRQLRVQRRDASGSLGPTVARHLVEGMVDSTEFKDAFYLSVDTSAEFTKRWDVELLKQWYSAGNDMAILSVAPTPVELKDVALDTILLHCSSRIASKDVDAVVQFNPPEPKPKPTPEPVAAPVLQSQYSELAHFGRVSALLNVRSDPHTPFVTAGREYARASRFWTSGYDFYTPLQATFFARYDLPEQTPRPDQLARFTRSHRRMRRLLGLPVSFAGEPLEDEARYSLGDRRTMEDWIRFSRIEPRAAFNESTVNQFTVCDQQLRYVPYSPVTPLVP